MKKILAVVAISLALAPKLSSAELVNDFHCTLNKGYTVPQLYAFQKDWMAAARPVSPFLLQKGASPGVA